MLEPFSGTGTTALCAAELGQRAWAFDINAFLVWLGRAKVARYSLAELGAARDAARALIEDIRSGSAVTMPALGAVTATSEIASPSGSESFARTGISNWR